MLGKDYDLFKVGTVRDGDNSKYWRETNTQTGLHPIFVLFSHFFPL